jgi:alginate O-acetyltransferase complex protein AlgJ
MSGFLRRHWMSALVAAFLAVCMVLTANKLVKRIRKGTVDDPGLQGMSVPLEPVAFTFDNFLNGRLQKYFEDQLARSVPVRRPAIRSFNQAWFDLFGSSYMYSGTIYKGRDGQLFERNYLESYCLNHFDAAAERGRIEDWAARLARLQQSMRAQGKTFVYLITPNKAMYQPEFLPPGYRCEGPRRARHAMMLEALERNRVDHVDGSKIVLGLKAGAGFPHFPRGGTHWTVYPAAVVGNALIAEAARQSGAALRPLDYTYRLAAGRKAYDASYTDLADLLNLVRYREYESEALPAWEFGRQDKAGRPGLATVVVGGSFNMLLLPLLSDSGAFEPIEFYYYTALGQYRYSGGLRTVRGPDGPKLREAIAGAEVLILEENEQTLASQHGKLLADEVLGPSG